MARHLNGRANVIGARCRYACASTWRYEHGQSLKDGPRPGTLAVAGDVRVCEHGRLWLFVDVGQDLFGNWFDRWRLVNRWWEPLLYRRATKALEAGR